MFRRNLINGSYNCNFFGTLFILAVDENYRLRNYPIHISFFRKKNTTHQLVLPPVSRRGWRYYVMLCRQLGRHVPYLIRLTWRARMGGDYSTVRHTGRQWETSLCVQLNVQTHTRNTDVRTRMWAHKTHVQPRWVKLRKGTEIKGRP